MVKTFKKIFFIGGIFRFDFVANEMVPVCVPLLGRAHSHRNTGTVP